MVYRGRTPYPGLPGLLQITDREQPAYASHYTLYKIAIAYRALLDAKAKGDKKGIERAKKEKARKLNKNERVKVQVMLRLEGYAFSYREAAHQFDVSYQAIYLDQEAVTDELLKHHRKFDRDADKPVAEMINQHARIVREMWRLYEEEKIKPSEKRQTLVAIGEENDRYLNRLQEAGVVPRAPKKYDWSKQLFPMPVAAEFVQAMIDAARASGLRGEQLRVFQREAVKRLQAKKDGQELMKGLTIDVTPEGEGE